ncbi:hypothetical protein [Marinicella gelatinilytica]|uniref:hypothetical protein n=1 Tax=Marinicella gelatinilytica TaxID=2996017 RepID=UPI002260E60B|nr:hypothetical protein [Marinicella gelatinilytica]MCX7544568.1 hypothetical protein [Marinicella gelatinilytica]
MNTQPSAILLSLVILMALNPIHVIAKKLYHCQSSDGTVVIQDRSCAATRLVIAKTDNKPVQKQTTQPKPLHTQPRPQSFSQAKHHPSDAISPQAFIEVVQSHKVSSELIPNNHGWQLKINMSGQEKAPNFKQPTSRISVTYFRDTVATLNKDAFSYALNLYHNIRHRYRLSDSQFKSHSDYKIFNVVYQKDSLLAYSEYYMGKLDGSLWVFSYETTADKMIPTQQLLARLQSLI